MRPEHYTRPPTRRSIHGLSPTTSPALEGLRAMAISPALHPHRRRLVPPVLTRSLDPDAPAAPRELTDLELEAAALEPLPPEARRDHAARLASKRRADLALYCRVAHEVYGTVIDPARLAKFDDLLIELETMAAQ
jgi:hypothetical protein